MDASFDSVDLVLDCSGDWIDNKSLLLTWLRVDLSELLMSALEVRTCSQEDLCDDALDEYVRAQETTTIRVVVDGTYAEKELAYNEDWDADEKCRIIQELRACVIDGGVVVAAFDRRSIMGFANVTSQRFGSKNQYVEMPYLHVSRQVRGMGIGRRLFELAVQEAKSLGAPFLYIATNPAVATQAFYDALGCVPAREQRPVEEGNDEIHHEYPLA